MCALRIDNIDTLLRVLQSATQKHGDTLLGRWQMKTEISLQAFGMRLLPTQYIGISSLINGKMNK